MEHIRSLYRLGFSRFFIALFIFLFVFSFPFKVFASFSDTKGHWAKVYVEELSEQGIVSGYLNGRFQPDAKLSRAEFVKILVLAFVGEDHLATSYNAGFKDVVSSAWYEDYVNTAVKLGLISSKNGSYFHPNEPITRASAAKMLVEAADITLKKGSKQHFDDVSKGSWYFNYVETLYSHSIMRGYTSKLFAPEKTLTRGQAAKIIYKAMQVDLAEETPAPPKQLAKAKFELSLAADYPRAKSIPLDGFDVPYVSFLLSAKGLSESVQVSQITVTRSGLGTPNSFSAVRLYKDGVQIGSDKNISSSTNQAVFNGLKLVIPAGSTAKIEVRADMAGNYSGGQSALGIRSATDITATRKIEGSFPLTGSTMSLANVNVATLNLTHSDVTGSATVGDQSVKLSQFRLSAGQTDSEIHSVQYRQTGSADATDFANFVLKVDGTVLAHKVTWQGKDVIFKLNTPFKIKRGDSRTFTLTGNIVGGIGSNFGFEVKDMKNLVAYDQVLDFRAKVTETSAFIPTTRAILGGAVNVSLSFGSSYSREVGKGMDAVELLRFNMVTRGDGIEVKQLNMILASTGSSPSKIDNIRGYALKSDGTRGKLLFGPVDPSRTTVGSETLRFTDDWEVPANTTQKIVVLGDVSSSVHSEDTYRLSMDMNSFEAEYLSNGDELSFSDFTPSNIVDGLLLIVASPTLTLSQAAYPQDHNAVVYSSGVDFLGLILDVNDVSDLEMNSLRLSLSSSSGDASYQDIRSCALYEDVNGARRSIAGAKSLKASSPDYVEFNGLNYVLKAGKSVYLLAVCDLASSASSGKKLALGILSNAHVSVLDKNGRSSTVVVSGAPLNQTGSSADAEVSIVGSGSLVLSLDDTSPSSYLVPTKTDMNLVSVFEFEARNDAYIINRFRLKIDEASAADEVRSLTVVYTDQNNKEITQTSSMNSRGETTFSNQTLYIPNSKKALLKVYANTNAESAGADSGTSLSVDFDFDSDFEARGLGANNRFTSVGSADVQGSQHVVYASDLLASIASDTATSSTTSDGNGQDVFKFKLTAKGENRPQLMALALTLSGTSMLNPSYTTGSAYLLNQSGSVRAEEAYVQATSNGGAVSDNQISFATTPVGIPVGANVIIKSGASTYVRKVTSITEGGLLSFTPSIAAYDDGIEDTLTYVPLQAGAGKLYFGAASALADDLSNADTFVSVVSTNGFSIGDVLKVRGADVNGQVRECSGTITGLPAATRIEAEMTCSSGDLLENYKPEGSADYRSVAYTGLIAEEVSGAESFQVRGDLTGISPSSGTRTLQVGINSGADITWNDAWANLGSDLDDYHENTQFFIQSTLLNKVKSGFKAFPLMGPSLSFRY